MAIKMGISPRGLPTPPAMLIPRESLGPLMNSTVLVSWWSGAVREANRPHVGMPRPQLASFLWLPPMSRLVVFISDTYNLDSDLVCRGPREGSQSRNMTERPPWCCPFRSSEIQMVSVVASFVLSYNQILSWKDVKTRYLTALREPSFWVEGACLKPPDVHVYRPHAALQHKAR